MISPLRAVHLLTHSKRHRNCKHQVRDAYILIRGCRLDRANSAPVYQEMRPIRIKVDVRDFFTIFLQVDTPTRTRRQGATSLETVSAESNVKARNQPKGNTKEIQRGHRAGHHDVDNKGLDTAGKMENESKNYKSIIAPDKREY